MSGWVPSEGSGINSLTKSVKEEDAPTDNEWF